MVVLVVIPTIHRFKNILKEGTLQFSTLHCSRIVVMVMTTQELPLESSVGESTESGGSLDIHQRALFLLKSREVHNRLLVILLLMSL